MEFLSQRVLLIRQSKRDTRATLLDRRRARTNNENVCCARTTISFLSHFILRLLKSDCVLPASKSYRQTESLWRKHLWIRLLWSRGSPIAAPKESQGDKYVGHWLWEALWLGCSVFTQHGQLDGNATGFSQSKRGPYIRAVTFAAPGCCILHEHPQSG